MEGVHSAIDHDMIDNSAVSNNYDWNESVGKLFVIKVSRCCQTLGGDSTFRAWIEKMAKTLVNDYETVIHLIAH